MIISTRAKFIFLSNPKAGSTSLRSLLLHLGNPHLQSQFKDPHRPFSEIASYLNARGISTHDFFIFTTIRNPWQRLVSAYRYQKRDRQGRAFYQPDYDPNSASSFSFSDFLKSTHNQDFYCGSHISNADWFCFENGACIVNKIYKLEGLRPEEIKNDLEKFHGVSSEILTFPKELPRLSPEWTPLPEGDKKDYRLFYTEKWMIDRVADIYAMDIKLGQYTFD